MDTSGVDRVGRPHTVNDMGDGGQTEPVIYAPRRSKAGRQGLRLGRNRCTGLHQEDEVVYNYPACRATTNRRSQFEERKAFEERTIFGRWS